VCLFVRSQTLLAKPQRIPPQLWTFPTSRPCSCFLIMSCSFISRVGNIEMQHHQSKLFDHLLFAVAFTAARSFLFVSSFFFSAVNEICHFHLGVERRLLFGSRLGRGKAVVENHGRQNYGGACNKLNEKEALCHEVCS